VDDNEKNIVTIVKEFYLTIQKYGYRKVLNKLNELKLPTFSQYENNIQNKIIYLVTSEYNSNIHELTKNNVRGDLGEARSMCIVLLKKYLNVSHSQIAIIFKRDTHSMVSNALNKHKNKSKNISNEKKYLDKYKRIERRLLQEINTMTKLDSNE
tara:strand:- start:160 stop:621 length:462 start_codon:yes stop_codon:yes gene_type:complete